MSQKSPFCHPHGRSQPCELCQPEHCLTHRQDLPCSVCDPAKHKTVEERLAALEFALALIKMNSTCSGACDMDVLQFKVERKWFGLRQRVLLLVSSPTDLHDSAWIEASQHNLDLLASQIGTLRDENKLLQAQARERQRQDRENPRRSVPLTLKELSATVSDAVDRALASSDLLQTVHRQIRRLSQSAGGVEGGMEPMHQRPLSPDRVTSDSSARPSVRSAELRASDVHPHAPLQVLAATTLLQEPAAAEEVRSEPVKAEPAYTEVLCEPSRSYSDSTSSSSYDSSSSSSSYSSSD